MGRTGMRGRGKLRRWGPNHCVMVVVSRWKRYLSTSHNQQNFITVDGKQVLEVIVVRKKESGEITLPSVSKGIQLLGSLQRSSKMMAFVVLTHLKVTDLKHFL